MQAVDVLTTHVLAFVNSVKSPDWFAFLADVLSIAGFGFTIWILFVTWSLKRAFALRARTPELRKSLTAVTKRLPPLLASWPATRNETLVQLAHGRAVLENLAQKLPRSERAGVTRLISKLTKKRTGLFGRVSIGQYSDAELWEIFAELQGIVASLEQREKDATWE